MGYQTPECYYFNDGNNSNALTAALMNGGAGGGMWNNPIWALVFLAFLNRDGNWFGGNGNSNCATQNQLSAIQETLNTNQGNTMLMDAIRGNGAAAHELASTINCDFNSVQTAIQNVQSAICNLGSKNDMNAMQIINAINNGDSALANQLSSCCCDVKQLVTTQGYENRLAGLQQSQLIQNGFAQVGYAAAENACGIKQNATDNTSRILAKLDDIEDSRKDREINALTAQIASLTAKAERQAELAPITAALAEISCKQPKTETVYAPSVVGIPTCQAYNMLANYGLYGAYASGGGFA